MEAMALWLGMRPSAIMFHHVGRSGFAQCTGCSRLSHIHHQTPKAGSVATMNEQMVDGFRALPTKGTKSTVGPYTLQAVGSSYPILIG
jgi:hypothetical protein